MSIKASGFSPRPSPAFVALGILLAILWFAGGASRGDVAGQIVVRAAAWLTLIVVTVFGRRPTMAYARPVWIFLGAAIAIAAIQLLPLPPALWRTLPDRQLIGDAAATSAGGAWQPLSLVPGATVNALMVLIVPSAVLVSVAASSKAERAWLPDLILILAVGSMLLGLLQFSGIEIGSPLVNAAPGTVCGTFANRNHFALFLALGSLVVPIWVFREGGRLQWRGPVGISLLLLFMLTILASGSRAGLAVGGLAIVIAGIIGLQGLRRRLRHAPRWVLPAALAAAIAILAAFVLVSLAADRAVSIQRGMAVDVEQDMRVRGLPTVMEMTRAAFPTGSGLGSFDQVFRAHEPLAVLKPTYFNHAHNDFIEVTLELGLPGVLLLAAALIWWAAASVGAWRDLANRRSQPRRLGSAMLLLIIVASVFDYPARTPLIMASIVVAAAWLATRADEEMVSALPAPNQLL